MIDARRRTIDDLGKVIEGSSVAHVWRSGIPRYDGADMVLQFRQPDEEVAEDDHGITDELFVEEVKLHYAGTMTSEQAAEKLAGMHVAVHAAESMRSE